MTWALVSIAVGLIVTFAGYGAFRVVLAMTGAVSGFWVGLLIAESVGLESFLAIVIGFAVAALFGWLAFAFYQVSVVLGLGWLGFVLGVSVTTMLGVTSNGVVVAVGLVIAALLIVGALASDLARILVVVVTAFGGAQVAVSGLMVLLGDGEVTSASTPSIAAAEGDAGVGWLWLIGSFVLAIAGVVVQSRSVGSAQTARAQWSGQRP